MISVPALRCRRAQSSRSAAPRMALGRPSRSAPIGLDSSTSYANSLPAVEITKGPPSSSGHLLVERVLGDMIAGGSADEELLGELLRETIRGVRGTLTGVGKEGVAVVFSRTCLVCGVRVPSRGGAFFVLILNLLFRVREVARAASRQVVAVFATACQELLLVRPSFSPKGSETRTRSKPLPAACRCTTTRRPRAAHARSPPR